MIECNPFANPNADKSLLQPVSEVYWPDYTMDESQIIVFDANNTYLGYAEPDLYRAEAIQYMSDGLDTLFGH